MTTPPKSSSSTDRGGRKRVCKACDRCRLKKSKCDGLIPCSRCKTDNTICVFGERKNLRSKVYPAGYVELLEKQQSQLVAGLQELYRRLINEESWTGSQLKEDGQGNPLIHDILEQLGYLKAEIPGSSEVFQANLEVLHQSVIAGEASRPQRATSLDTFSDIDTLSSFEHISPRNPPALVDTFPTSYFASAPWSRSPPSQCTEVLSALDTTPLSVVPQTQSNLLWQHDTTGFTNTIDFNVASCLPLNDPTTGLVAISDANYHQTSLVINHYLATKEWSAIDDPMQQYFNPNTPD